MKERVNMSLFNLLYSSIIRQKGESQNGGNKKIKHVKFSEKNKTFFTLLYSHVRVRIRG